MKHFEDLDYLVTVAESGFSGFREEMGYLRRIIGLQRERGR